MLWLATLVSILAAESPGRGENPSNLGGILIIVGIAATFLLVLGVAMYRRKPGRR